MIYCVVTIGGERRELIKCKYINVEQTQYTQNEFLLLIFSVGEF